MTYTTLTPARLELGNVVLRGVELIQLWARRARQRRELQRLDARLLADIGLSPYDVAREASKPFWRA